MIDNVYYVQVGAVRLRQESAQAEKNGSALSDEMIRFVDHLADLLAEEFAAALKEERDARSGIRQVLEREPTGAKHRGSHSGLPAVREP